MNLRKKKETILRSVFNVTFSISLRLQKKLSLIDSLRFTEIVWNHTRSAGISPGDPIKDSFFVMSGEDVGYSFLEGISAKDFMPKMEIISILFKSFLSGVKESLLVAERIILASY